MKARIKATGEIFKVMEYSHDAKGGYVVLSGGQVMKADCVELILESNHTDWEQRRYEIAREAMNGFLSASVIPGVDPNPTYKDIATFSVRLADTLIEELKNGNENI